jgi:hypothetical protein
MVSVAPRAVLRLIVGPLAVAIFAGIRLAPYGALTAAAGVYFTFVVAQAAIVLWARYQLRRARSRAAARRRLIR